MAFNYQISKQNELKSIHDDFSFSEQMRIASRNELWRNKEALWTIISGICDDTAKECYSKIQNMVSEIADVETCNIHALKSIAKSVDAEFLTKDLREDYDSDILNLINLFSVQREILLNTNVYLHNDVTDKSFGYLTLKSINLSPIDKVSIDLLYDIKRNINHLKILFRTNIILLRYHLNNLLYYDLPDLPLKALIDNNYKFVSIKTKNLTMIPIYLSDSEHNVINGLNSDGTIFGDDSFQIYGYFNLNKLDDIDSTITGLYNNLPVFSFNSEDKCFISANINDNIMSAMFDKNFNSESQQWDITKYDSIKFNEDVTFYFLNEDCNTIETLQDLTLEQLLEYDNVIEILRDLTLEQILDFIDKYENNKSLEKYREQKLIIDNEINYYYLLINIIKQNYYRDKLDLFMLTSYLDTDTNKVIDLSNLIFKIIGTLFTNDDIYFDKYVGFHFFNTLRLKIENDKLKSNYKFDKK